MDEQRDESVKPRAAVAQTGDASAGEGENELEAEQESAEAMDAEVPQPPDASKTTEGQPS
jgi:hypothetical protein